MASVNDFEKQSLGHICPAPDGEYSPDKVYKFLNAVTYQGGSYLAKKNDLQGVAPTANQSDDNWFCMAISGQATPDYLAAHDRVMNAARQTELDRAATELAEQNVSSMETNVEQMQADVIANAAQVARDKDSAAGYAQAAEVSRQAAETSEQNVAALVNGFDDHVSQKTTEATGTIETARQQAISVVQQQGAESVQGVIDDTEAYFEEKKAAALSEISDKTSEVVKAVTDEGQKQIGLVDAAGAAQVAAVSQEGADQIANIQMEAESYIRREDANKLVFKGQAEGRSHHVDDSADWGFLGMQGYGESTQVQTTGAQLYDFANKRSSTNATANEDGYITITIDNTGGTAEKFGTYYTYPYEGLEPSKTYRCICEIKAVSGKGEFQAVNETVNAGMPGQFATKFAPTLAVGTYASNITARDSLTESMTMTRTYAKAAAGNTLSVTFRLSIIEDTTVTPDNFTYEPYTGGAPSPSTAYPQEIVSKCQARQLFDASAITDGSYVSDTSGQVVSGGPTAVGANASDYIPIAGYDYVTVTTNMVEKCWGAFYGADKSFLQGITGYGTLAVPENAHYMRLTIKDDALDTCMINAGTIPGAWAPYGKYGLETVVTGAQLLDTTAYKPSNVRLIKDDPQELIIQNNDVTTGTLMRIIRFLIPKKIVSAWKITVGFDYAQVGDPQKIGYPAVAISWGNGTKDELKTIGRKTETKQTGTLSYTFELPKADIENPEYTSLVVWIYSQSVVTTNVLYESKLTIRNLMCNLGESVKPWQLYDEQILRAALDMPLRGIPVSSGGNVTIDGREYIADYRDWERGKHVQMVAEEVFDGSADENWTIYDNETYKGFCAFSKNLKLGTRHNGFCNKFPVHLVATLDTAVPGVWLGANSKNIYFHNCFEYASTIEEWYAWLAEHPVTMLYPLENPIETDIPSEELAAYRRLHAYHGTTNIHNSDDVYTAVEYARDPDMYLNNKLAEISAAIIGG